MFLDLVIRLVIYKEIASHNSVCESQKDAMNDNPSILPTSVFFHLCLQSRDQTVCPHNAEPSGEE